VPFVGALDAYESGLKIGFDVTRRLLSSYTGPSCLVRADRTGQPTMDLAYKADGAWDTDALLSFAAGDSVYLVTAYPQIGSIQFTQPLAGSQPRLVNAGVLDADGAAFINGRKIAATLDAGDFTGGAGTTVQVVSRVKMPSGGGGGLWSFLGSTNSGMYVNAYGGLYSDVPDRIVGAVLSEGVSHTISQERSGANNDLRVDNSIVVSSTSASGVVAGTGVDFVIGDYFAMGLTLSLGAFCVWDNTTDAAGRAAALA